MTPRHWLWRLFLAILLAGQGTVALEIDEDKPETVKKAAATVAGDLMDMYQENIDKTGIIGKLDGTWWVGGAIFMTMMQYWHLTGDGTYNDVVTDGMLAQKGAHNNYFPSNWSSWMGNDDQIFWGLAAITAAELNFPERDDQPSWVALAQGVFNNQVPRWDDKHCGGGMRWQCWPWQSGYTLKNSVSNGGLFQLSSRLLYYTDNQTYSHWANKIYDWSAMSLLVNESNWIIVDNTNIQHNCTLFGPAQWTYNYAMYISGSAYMYNYTDGKEPKWKERVVGLLNTTYERFFPEKYGGLTLSEYNCEIPEACDGNSSLFKGFLASWMAFMTTLVPDTTKGVMKRLKASAIGAAGQCSGGESGTICGQKWFMDKWDGTSGIGRETSSLSVLSSTLIGSKRDAAPKSGDTGGTSKPDPSTGTGGDSGNNPPNELREITTADRAGAGILTAIFVAGWIGAITWMVYD